MGYGRQVAFGEDPNRMWSFFGLKHNKQWIWLAPDSDSREIVGMHVGSRDHSGAEALWKSLPPVYRQCAVCYTDFWSAYEQVLPQNRHRAVGKESGKKIENHIGAIWNFIHYYNDEIAPKLAITTR